MSDSEIVNDNDNEQCNNISLETHEQERIWNRTNDWRKQKEIIY